MSDDPVRDQDKFMLRLPEGMRDRIKISAERNGRSMNAEIIQALEQMFPAQPTIDDVLEKVHHTISLAKHSSFPYRQSLINALDEFRETVASGIEFDQFQSNTYRPVPDAEEFNRHEAALARLRRASKEGVDTADLERELSKGLVKALGRSKTRAAILSLREGKHESALKILRLNEIKFADPEAAFAAILRNLADRYQDTWGDLKEPIVPDEP
ncbi:Arc family DNA-binding protein [Rhizobium laguerreae]|nr:Arc family DNA-binding protein [Rhizobium laguerreae]